MNPGRPLPQETQAIGVRKCEASCAYFPHKIGLECFEFQPEGCLELDTIKSNLKKSTAFVTGLSFLKTNAQIYHINDIA